MCDEPESVKQFHATKCACPFIVKVNKSIFLFILLLWLSLADIVHKTESGRRSLIWSTMKKVTH